MKHVEVGHHLSLLHAGLKTNKAAWDYSQLKVDAIKSKNSVGSNREKELLTLISQQTQTYAVIVLIANCMIEAIANCYLAKKCSEEQFAALERLSTLEKLVVAPKFFLKEYEFPVGEMLYCELKSLLDLRNSLVHSKPKVVVNGKIIHKGNLAKSTSISNLPVDKCVSLPFRLVEHFCLYDHGDAFELAVYSCFETSEVKQIISKVRAKSAARRASKTVT